MKKLHSIDVIEEIAKKNKSIKEFYFSAYFYIPAALSDKGRLIVHKIKRNPLKGLRERIYSLKILEGWSLGLISKVKMTNDSFQYIPQIDFICPISKKNLNLIKKNFSSIIKVFPGYILETRHSYHYLGLKLLNKNKLIKFIGNCLLCGGRTNNELIADVRWLGHALRNGYMDLRISATNSGPEPRVVAFLRK